MREIRNKSLNSPTHQSPPRPREKMPTVYRHLIADKPFVLPSYNNLDNNASLGLTQPTHRMRIRRDQDVERQRSSMLIKSGRMSEQNPQWRSSVNQYYKKGMIDSSSSRLIDGEDTNSNNNSNSHNHNHNHTYNPFRMTTSDLYGPENGKFDVFNREKPVFAGRNEDNYYSQMRSSMYRRKGEELAPLAASHLSSFSQEGRKTLNWQQHRQKQIPDKVGCVNYRDFTIKRPLLKIGKQGTFVDTYSPF